jgi:hypothetical protein
LLLMIVSDKRAAMLRVTSLRDFLPPLSRGECHATRRVC